jgi:hypothetical protein
LVRPFVHYYVVTDREHKKLDKAATKAAAKQSATTIKHHTTVWEKNFGQFGTNKP